MGLELGDVLRSGAVAQVQLVLLNAILSPRLGYQILSIVKRLYTAIVSRWKLVLEANLSLVTLRDIWVARHTCGTQALVQVLGAVVSVAITRILELVLH